MKKLKARIDAKHAEALRALDVIEGYLETEETPEKTVLSGNGREPQGTFRDRVLGSLSDQWQSIEDLAEVAGLEEKQVRGVLYSKKAVPMIDVRMEGRRARYRRREPAHTQ